ncbi:MAG: hypothetical protein DWI58_09235 [Chloroflexi bacterium]|nr:MAG: hypothetical protein DWI58_09235 [Chloroflexota bacterium]
MSLLSAIFGAAKPTYRAREQKAAEADCLNHKLQPRWRGPQVMEDDTKAMGYVCHSCGREYLTVEVEDRHLIREPGR